MTNGFRIAGFRYYERLCDTITPAGVGLSSRVSLPAPSMEGCCFMASPFSVFRKRQKLMMAILCLLAMVSFVILPYISDLLGLRSSPNRAVVTSKFGSLRESDVAIMRQQHQKVLGVLTEVLQRTVADPQMAGRVRAFLESRFGPATEESVVDTWVLARHAESLGMVVNDEAINSYLEKLTQNKVQAGEIQGAFKHAQISALQFFNAMRDELMVIQLRDMFQVTLYATTPAQRWDYFRRVKESATIEALPVPASLYLDKVATPSDEELQKFFEENKERYPLPMSPEPGFRQPQKIQAQYFKADYDKLVAAVTEDEIKARYEKDKKIYEPFEKAAAKRAEEAKDAEKKDSAEEKKATEETKSDEVKKPDEEKKDVEEKKSDEEKKPSEEKKPDEEKKPEGTLAVERPSPFMLTALAEEEAAAKPQATAEEPAAKPQAAEDAEKPAEKSADKPAEKPEAAVDMVKKYIRKQITNEIVKERVAKMFTPLRDDMERYRRDWNNFDDARIRKGSKQVPEPAKLDFDAMAKEHGLTTGETGWITAMDAAGTEFGSSTVENVGPFALVAFSSVTKFRPETSRDRQGNYYLFWKTADEKDRVPKFEDEGVREEVLRTWKMIEARTPALAEANKLAEQARKEKKFLKHTFVDQPDLRVVQPDPFSWLTFGNVPLGSAPGAVRLSSVSGVDRPGEAFMQTVFGLAKGEVGVAMNAPQTVAYVIRMTELTPSETSLWSQFKASDYSTYAPAAQQDQRQMYLAWLKEIKTNAKVDWNRKPVGLNEGGSGGPSSPGDEE